MKKLLIAATVVVALAAAPSANAQFSKLPFGKKSADKDAGAADGTALVSTFDRSQALVLSAQTHLTDALGLKDQLALLQAEQKAMSSGQTDTDALKKRRALSDAAQKAIDARVAEQPELSDAARGRFAEGLVDYVKAVGSTGELTAQASGFMKNAGANPMALMGNAKTAAYVGKEVPGYVKGLGSTTRALLQYAKRNSIAAPANATAALDGL